MRILVIDGNATDRGAISLTLLAENMSLELTDSGEEGVSLAKLYDFDLVTLELQLPDITGFEALRQIRRANIKTPVLIVSKMALVSDVVKALGSGADDYLTKPYDPLELVARINALVRRSKGLAESTITTGNITLNLNTKSVTVAGNPIHMTNKEYQMLELLSLRKGITISKESFMQHLYGGMDEPELKIIDVFICKLRKKLANASEGRNFIETVWGRGYVLRDGAVKPVSMTSEVASLVDDPPTGFVPNITFTKRKAVDRQASEAKAVHIRIPA